MILLTTFLKLPIHFSSKIQTGKNTLPFPDFSQFQNNLAFTQTEIFHTYQLHMKLFNHLNLQIHNVPVACFSRNESKIIVRIVNSITNSRSLLFQLLDTNKYYNNSHIIAPCFYLLFNVEGRTSYISKVRTHLIFTISFNYCFHLPMK